jgi:membrane protease YdiL (CAAX protease family)
MADTQQDAYSSRQVLWLWTLATLPMVLVTWVVAPWLISSSGAPAGLVYFFLSALGMAWQGTLAWIMLRREGRPLSWQGLRDRLWLTRPAHSGTKWGRGRTVITALGLTLVAGSCLLVANAAAAATMVFRFLRDPFWSRFFPGHAKTFELMSPELAGQWWWLVIVPVVALPALLLGEELFFRGLLLPRMRGPRGRGRWLTNASLYALYHLYQPWMIPARFVATLGSTWAAERYRSNWIPALVRLHEVAGLALAVLIGVLGFAFPPLPPATSLPYFERRPPLQRSALAPLAELPACDPSRPQFSVDLLGKDASKLDLRTKAKDLECVLFDDLTAWPPSDRLPAGFDPGRILAQNKNPGLGLRALQARGVTGRGVSVAIIDLPLLTEHQEYASRLSWFEEIDPTPRVGERSLNAQMHGTAMASVAVGRTVGVAPEAELFAFGLSYATPQEFLLMPHYFALVIERIVEVNRQLPAGRKIRAITLSHGWGEATVGRCHAEKAVARAAAEGIAFFGVTQPTFGGLGRPPLGDPDKISDYEPAWRWRKDVGKVAFPFYIPIDTRSMASEQGVDSYLYSRYAASSLGPPFMAGLYALAAQVDPSITRERFLGLAERLARRDVRPDMPILDPVAMIEELVAGRVRHSDGTPPSRRKARSFADRESYRTSPRQGTDPREPPVGSSAAGRPCSLQRPYAAPTGREAPAARPVRRRYTGRNGGGSKPPPLPPTRESAWPRVPQFRLAVARPSTAPSSVSPETRATACRSRAVSSRTRRPFSATTSRPSPTFRPRSAPPRARSRG